MVKYAALIDIALKSLLGEEAFSHNDIDAIVRLVVQMVMPMVDDGTKKKEIRRAVMTRILMKYCIFYIKEQFEEDTFSSESDQGVNLSNCMDLVCHTYDYPETTFKDDILQARNEIVMKLKKIPQQKQGTQAWLDQRAGCLTATAVAIAIDEDPYKYPVQILLDKCGLAEPFIENENVHHGKKYEPIANMYYCFRNNIQVGEYGLLNSTKEKMIAASPDGICDKSTYYGSKLSKLVGRLLEIKCPKVRRIKTEGDLDGDICPHYYWVQVQTQLFVTELDECDFLQCEIEEYHSWEEFLADSQAKIPGLSKKTGLEKGCIIQLLPKNKLSGDADQCLYNAKYIYPASLHMTQEQYEKWILETTMNFHKDPLSKDYVFDKVICWRFRKIACHLIKRDDKWMNSKLPMLRQFWKYVEFYRENPNKLKKLVTLVQELEPSATAELFRKIHRDYLLEHPNTKFQPLHQEENEERKKINKKKEFYKNKTFNGFKKNSV